MKKSASSSKIAKQKEIDRLVDRFVAKVNSGHREPIMTEIYPTPSSVLVGGPDEHDEYDWMIKPYTNADWVEPLEQRLGYRFPVAYRSLITRYIYPGFEYGNVLFFGNTPEGTDYYELRERIFNDRNMYKALSTSGFVQFGKPDSVNYDPICFDMNRLSGDDCPIVQIDHEGILCADVIDIVKQPASSFTELLDSTLSA